MRRLARKGFVHPLLVNGSRGHVESCTAAAWWEHSSCKGAMRIGGIGLCRRITASHALFYFVFSSHLDGRSGPSRATFTSTPRHTRGRYITPNPLFASTISTATQIRHFSVGTVRWERQHGGVNATIRVSRETTHLVRERDGARVLPSDKDGRRAVLSIRHCGH